MTRLARVLSYLLALSRPSLRLARSPERLLLPFILALLTLVSIFAAIAPLKIARGNAYANAQVDGHLAIHLVQGTTDPQIFADQVAALVRRLEENQALASIQIATGPDLETSFGVLFGQVDVADQLYGGLVRLDLRERPGQDANLENLQFAVSDMASAHIDDFRTWREAGAQQTRQALYLGLGIFALVVALVIALLSLTLLLSLKMHEVTLRVVHQLGATDAFGALLFQSTTFVRALIGSFAGALVSAGLLWGLNQWLAARGAIGAAQLGGLQLAALILIPLLLISLCVAVARRVAMRVLRSSY